MAQDIGLLLRGLGASFANQVPQFRQELAQQQQMERQQREDEYTRQQRARQAQMQDYEFRQAIQDAGFQDAYGVSEFLKNNNIEGALGLLEDRMSLMNQMGVSLPGDPTMQVYEDLKAAALGDTTRLGRARATAGVVLAQGITSGRFRMPEAKAATPIAGSNIMETTQGPVVPMLQPDGTITTVPVPAQMAPKPEEPPKTFQESGELRREFSAIPVVRDFAQQSTAMGRILASAAEPSAAGDMALVFNFMKVLDPGSTVREGEYANAQNAGGVDDKIVSIYNRMVDGEILTQPQRADFVNRADRLYKSAESGFMRTYNQYKNIATRRNLPLEDVLIDYRLESIAQPRTSRAAPIPSQTTVERGSLPASGRPAREFNWSDL